ncbi:hypothetical protein [Bradyrhizobium elkanii]|uniref:hypothetical protein n=1 Tax=Bradyrhizobium elkanii TaxID=29448 RepID=UPI00209EB3D5|nr:hypothetical protein [Bradyrhizobium elkanii]MCP1974466.1 hypothetical protein [Bradyrhizobium elkanii]MCS3521545.1 hypothetical protein [Bradyrhizobium elkanii]MCS4069200.1 hypothetical protein [Bradyrhizobium elkanii]MCS4084734.1 hypothetical protein [Bradyrhizobium elkanii]MCS4104029.1 hypothetical protein [Bradyrhizobium elkanii]
MISTWSEWKRYPRPGRGENIEAPISPGLYEVRYAGTGALHSFEAVENVARALALLQTSTKSWFGRRDARAQADLEYRTCATSTKADAKAAAERMIGRRETYMSGGAV